MTHQAAVRLAPEVHFTPGKSLEGECNLELLGGISLYARIVIQPQSTPLQTIWRLKSNEDASALLLLLDEQDDLVLSLASQSIRVPVAAASPFYGRPIVLAAHAMVADEKLTLTLQLDGELQMLDEGSRPGAIHFSKQLMGGDNGEFVLAEVVVTRTLSDIDQQNMLRYLHSRNPSTPSAI